MRFGFRRPPPPTSQRAGACGTWARAAAVASTVNALKVAAPSASLRLSTQAASGVEMIAVERFRRLSLEIGIAHQRGERGRVDAAACRQHPVVVEGQSAPRGDKVVDERIGRAGVEGDDLAPGAEVGDVADPAPIEDHERAREARGHRRVIDRRERRAFAPGLRRRPSESPRPHRGRAPPPRARRRRAGASRLRAADAGSSGHAGRPARRARAQSKTDRETPRPPRHGRR